MPKPCFTPHPNSAPGDFYVVNGECLTCGVPHVLAPDLVDWADLNQNHCIWKKQPQTPEEIERAIAVMEGQEIGCHRYAGKDKYILSKVSSEYCDYPMNPWQPFKFDPPADPQAFRFSYSDQKPNRILALLKKLLKLK